MAALEENAELYERINRELAIYGELTSKTANDLKDAQTGVKNFNLKIDTATTAVGSLADAFVSYNKEIYAGSSANKAAAANQLAAIGGAGLNAANTAAASRIGYAGAPQDLYSKYASIVFGTPQASTNPNYAGTQGGTSTGSSKSSRI
jgi:hypothetical protein